MQAQEKITDDFMLGRIAHYEFWTRLGKAKLPDPLRARNWRGKLGGEWRPQGAQGSVSPLVENFHYNLPKAANRAVGTVHGVLCFGSETSVTWEAMQGMLQQQTRAKIHYLDDKLNPVSVSLGLVDILTLSRIQILGTARFFSTLSGETFQ
jgi:hypothetical protein